MERRNQCSPGAGGNPCVVQLFMILKFFISSATLCPQKPGFGSEFVSFARNARINQVSSPHITPTSLHYIHPYKDMYTLFAWDGIRMLN